MKMLRCGRWSQARKVTEDQLEALFGRGVHPNAEALTRSLMAQTSRNVAVAATRLGRLFQS